MVSIENNGERLVPGESYDTDEVIRHKSSYAFFRRVIECDLLFATASIWRRVTASTPRLHILDVGCGSGHGTYMLANILGASVVGIDASRDAIEYACKVYKCGNVRFECADALEYASRNIEFDYVVSRHAFEHIDHGIDAARKFLYRYRLLVNVPYLEPANNPFHLVNDISVDNFINYKNPQFYYESLDGTTYDSEPTEQRANSIICVESTRKCTNLCRMLKFPLAPWKPEYLQHLGLQYPAVVREKEALALELEQLRQHLRQKEAILAEHQKGLDWTASTLAQREAVLQQHSDELRKLSEMLGHRESILRAHQDSLAEKEALLVRRDAILTAHQKALALREELLAQREARSK